jgi:pilus assembly protein CpaE
MIRYALKSSETESSDATPAAHITAVPRVSIQAFCEAPETATVMQTACEDRRMAKAHVKVQMGGIAAAVEAYRSSPTPNVIIIEWGTRGEDLLAGLDQLAEVCDAASRVIVVGQVNDIVLYRELVRRGVSDYLIAPVDALQLIRAVSGLFSAPDVKPVGRTIAVVGAKGGVGASTVAHNIAWALARDLGSIRSSPISTWRSAPPASITIRIPPKASPTRCSPPSASTPPSSIGCCRNAPIT